MLSDDSSSDSETGRFKSRTVTQDEKSCNNKQDRFSNRPGRSRNENDRFRRDFDRRRDERERFDKHTRERPRYSRHSPVHRRKYSRERSPNRRSDERPRHGDSRSRSKPRDHRSDSRDRYKNFRTQDSPDRKKEVKDEIVKRVQPRVQPRERSQERQINKYKENASLSPDYKGNRSEVYKPPVAMKRKSKSPIIVDDHSDNAASDDVQPGSYYSMIPAVVVKDKSEESSEIDSSDDERLRAKLLNLEKELHKTKKKKHKKKHKRKSSKSSRDRDDASSAVEVSSTTDIQEPDKVDGVIISLDAAPEVTSTQKNTQRDSSEEGEISSDESQDDIDPTDLRHKLRRSGTKQDLGNEPSNKDVCGPALPPHLQKRACRSASPGTEGPALPPHLQKTSKNIGPTIPDDMRKVLAENDCEVIEESSDEGIGPLPAGAEDKWSTAHHKLEERALDMKIKQLDGHSLQNHKIKSREQWMLELPESKAKILGLEARSFRAKEGPDMSDRSSWTDTPEDKARKAAGIQKEEDADAALQRDARARHIANRDDEQESAIKKHKKKHKREESLLDLHQKKLKKKKKKDSKDEDKKERRPFSRDVDLQVNRFDEAQKKSIIKKAQDLNTRFSRGEAKFL